MMEADEASTRGTPKKGISASRQTSPEPQPEPPFLATTETGSQTERTEDKGKKQIQTTLDQSIAKETTGKKRTSPMKGMKRPDQALRMLGNKRGRGNKGKHPRLSEEARRNLAQRMLGNTFGHVNRGIAKSEEWKRKASLAKIGDKNPMKNPVYARRMADSKRGKSVPKLKEFWRIHHDDQIKRMMVGEHKKPNKLERRLIELIRRNGLPFRYVGNWEFMVAGKCPDFLHGEGKKLLIELFGNYWHTVKARETVEQRVERFRKQGYETLVIWEKEMEDEKTIVEKIRRFSAIS